MKPSWYFDPFGPAGKNITIARIHVHDRKHMDALASLEALAVLESLGQILYFFGCVATS